jgi:AAA15 family ATPase/GTPase
MSEHFIKEIEIKDYKLFKDFKAEGFGRVNLIGGKNNVGKTAFMEACFLTDALSKSSINFISALFTVESTRKILTDLNQKVLYDILKRIAPLKLQLNNGYKVELKYEDNRLKLNLTTNEETIDLDNMGKPELYVKLLVSFITSNSINCSQINTNEDFLNILYDGVKKLRKREELNLIINRFDKDIIEIDIIENNFQLYSKSRKKWISITEYGDGVKYYIAYISAIWSFRNNIIFIDEIENGIHYTNFDKLWELILTLSKEQNVQVFATTHSKECIESYARVAKKLEDKEIAFIEMGINKYNKPRAIVMDSERFFRELETGNEVRGW